MLENSSKKARITGVAVLVVLVAVVVISAVSKRNPFMDAGAAAHVNGVTITEGQVTDLVMSRRHAAGLDDDEAWHTWMADNAQNAVTLRDDALTTLTRQELARQAAAEQNVVVGDDEVNKEIETARSSLIASVTAQVPGSSDEDGDGAVDEEPLLSVEEQEKAWQDALSASGYDEETFREATYCALLESRLEESVESFSARSEITYEPAPKNLPYE